MHNEASCMVARSKTKLAFGNKQMGELDHLMAQIEMAGPKSTTNKLASSAKDRVAPLTS